MPGPAPTRVNVLPPSLSPTPTKTSPVSTRAGQLVAARTDPATQAREKEREANIRDTLVAPRVGARTPLSATASGRVVPFKTTRPVTVSGRQALAEDVPPPITPIETPSNDQDYFRTDITGQSQGGVGTRTVRPRYNLVDLLQQPYNYFRGAVGVNFADEFSMASTFLSSLGVVTGINKIMGGLERLNDPFQAYFNYVDGPNGRKVHKPLTMEEWRQTPEGYAWVRTDNMQRVNEDEVENLRTMFADNAPYLGTQYDVVKMSRPDQVKARSERASRVLLSEVAGLFDHDTSRVNRDMYKQATGQDYPIPMSPEDLVLEEYKDRGYTRQNKPSKEQFIADVESMRQGLTAQRDVMGQRALEAQKAGNYQEAVDAYVEYFRLDSQTYRNDFTIYPGAPASAWEMSVTQNPYYVYSMAANPVSYNMYLKNLAEASAQLGRPLDFKNYEDRKVFVNFRDDNTNWGDEMLFAAIVDPLTDASITGTGMALKGAWKGAGRVITSALPPSVQKALTFEVKARAVRSAASEIGNHTENVLRAARFQSPLTLGRNTLWGSAVEEIVGWSGPEGKVGTGVPFLQTSMLFNSPGSLADTFEDTLRMTTGERGAEEAAKRIPGTLFGPSPQHSAQILTEITSDLDAKRALGHIDESLFRSKISAVLPAPGRWKKIVINAHSKVAKRAFTSKYDTLIRKGIAKEEAARRAANYALDYANNSRNVVKEVRSTFESAFIAMHTPSAKLGVVDDSVVWKIFKDVPKAYRAVGSVIDAFTTIRGIWAKSVLSMRPAWVARNIIDTYLRVLIETGGRDYLSNFVAKTKRLAPFLDELPLPSSINKTMASQAGDELGTSVFDRLLSNPDRYKFPYVHRFIQDAWGEQRRRIVAKEVRLFEAGAKASPITKFLDETLGGVNAFASGMQDFNSLIELAARIHTLDYHFSRVFGILDPSRWNVAENWLKATFPNITDETVALGKQLWDESSFSLQRLVQNLNTAARKETGTEMGFAVSHALFMPEETAHILRRLSTSDQIFFREHFITRLDNYFVEIMNSGRMPTELDLHLFVQDIRNSVTEVSTQKRLDEAIAKFRDAAKSVDTDLDEAMRPVSEGVENVAGQPNVTGIDTEKPGAIFDEPATDAPIKPDPRVPEGAPLSDQNFVKPDPSSSPELPNMAQADDVSWSATEGAEKVRAQAQGIEEELATLKGEGLETEISLADPLRAKYNNNYQRIRNQGANVARSRMDWRAGKITERQYNNMVHLHDQFYYSDYYVNQFLLHVEPGPLNVPWGQRKEWWDGFFRVSNGMRDNEAAAYARRLEEQMASGKFAASNGGQVLDDMGVRILVDEKGMPSGVTFQDVEGKITWRIHDPIDTDAFLRSFFGDGYQKEDIQKFLDDEYWGSLKTSYDSVPPNMEGLAAGPKLSMASVEGAPVETTLSKVISQHEGEHLVAVDSIDELVPRGTRFNVLDYTRHEGAIVEFPDGPILLKDGSTAETATIPWNRFQDLYNQSHWWRASEVVTVTPGAVVDPISYARTYGVEIRLDKIHNTGTDGAFAIRGPDGLFIRNAAGEAEIFYDVETAIREAQGQTISSMSMPPTPATHYPDRFSFGFAGDELSLQSNIIGGYDVTPTERIKLASPGSTRTFRDTPETYTRIGVGPRRPNSGSVVLTISRGGNQPGRGAIGNAIDQLEQIASLPDGGAITGAAGRRARAAAIRTLEAIDDTPSFIKNFIQRSNMQVYILSPEEYTNIGVNFGGMLMDGTYLIVPPGGLDNPAIVAHEAIHWMLARGNVPEEVLTLMDNMLSKMGDDSWAWLKSFDGQGEVYHQIQRVARGIVDDTIDPRDAYNSVIATSDTAVAEALIYNKLPIPPDYLGGQQLFNITALVGAVSEMTGMSGLGRSLTDRVQAEVYTYIAENNPALKRMIFAPFAEVEQPFMDAINRLGFGGDFIAARQLYDQSLAGGVDAAVAAGIAGDDLATRVEKFSYTLGLDENVRKSLVQEVAQTFTRLVDSNEILRDAGAHVPIQEFAMKWADRLALPHAAEANVDFLISGVALDMINMGVSEPRAYMYSTAVAFQKGLLSEEEMLARNAEDITHWALKSQENLDELLVAEPTLYYNLRTAAYNLSENRQYIKSAESDLMKLVTVSSPEELGALRNISRGVMFGAAPPVGVKSNIATALVEGGRDATANQVWAPSPYLVAELGGGQARIMSAVSLHKKLNPHIMVDPLDPLKSFIPPSVENASVLNPRVKIDYQGLKDPVEKAKFQTELEEELNKNKDELSRSIFQAKFGPLNQSLEELLGESIVGKWDNIDIVIAKLRVRMMADAGEGMNVDGLQLAYNHLMQYQFYIDTYAEVLGLPKPYAIAGRSTTILPPAVGSEEVMQRYTEYLNEFGKQEQFMKTLDEMEMAVNSRLRSGQVKGLMIPADQQDILSQAAEGIVRQKEDAINIALRGSNGAPVPELGNQAWEGAIPKTTTAMIDYENYNKLEASVKAVAPFALFTMRSIPYWAQTITLHPEIARLYMKYIHVTNQVNRQDGLTSSTGEPLRAYSGHVRIPGTDIYVNPTAPMSFRYLFAGAEKALFPDEEYYEEEKNVVQQVANEFYSISRALGFDLPPWVSGPAMAMGILDRESVTPYAVIPQLELIPWWGLSYVNENFRKMYDKNIVGWANPQVSWQDMVIEREALKVTMEKVQQATSETDSWNAISEYQQAMGYREIGEYPGYRIAPREESQLWLDARRNVERQDWYFTLAGYITGVYGKRFTDADAELRMIRNDINNYRKSINNELGQEMLRLDPSLDPRDIYVDKAYSTPEGNINLLYNLGRYVTIPDTKSEARGDERRKIMAKTLAEDVMRGDFIEEKKWIREWRETELSRLAVGSDFSLQQPIYERAAEMTRDLEENPMYAQYTGYGGFSTYNKSPEEIQKYYVDKIMYYVNSTKPDWDRMAMDYPTYVETKYSPWLATIPEIAGTYIASMNLDANRAVPDVLRDLPNIHGPGPIPISGGAPDQVKEILDMTKFLEQWYAEVTPEYYAEWKKGNNDIGEALNDAWNAIVWTPYWDGQEGLTHSAEKELYHQNFVQNMPDQNKIIEWMLMDPIYSERFTQEEIEAYLKGAGGMVDPGERLTQGQTGSEQEAQDIWDVLLAVGPGNEGRQALELEIARLGGDPSDLNTFYDTGGAWGSTPSRAAQAGFTQFHALVLQAANNLNLEPPSREVLMEFSVAQKDNDLFRQYAEKEYGAQIWTDLAVYGNSDYAGKRDLLNEKPHLKQYWSDKDTFATDHQTWAKYYNPEQYVGAVAGGGSVGGGGYGRAYTTETRIRKRMVPIPYDSGLSESATPMGRRVSVDPSALGKLGAMGSAGNVPWPAGFSKLIGPLAMKEIQEMYTVRVPLAKKTVEFLAGMAQRNPQYKSTVTTILDETTKIMAMVDQYGRPTTGPSG